tara:strand:- start:4440 stop:5504 length:1065 start_codon:yes stop_codon:yes gene_type:complete
MYLFIQGMYRSGTTTFSKILSNHPELVIKNDTLFPLFKNIKSKVEFNLGENKSVYISDYFLKNQNIFDAIQKFNLKENIFKKKKLKKEIINYVKNYSPELKKKINDLNYSTYYKLIVSFFDILKREKEVNVLGIKEVWTNEFYKPLKNYFPKAKFIFIIRNPKGIIASSLKDKNSNYKIYFLIKQWRKIAYLSHYYNKKNTILVKYENLIKQNKKTLHDIGSYLNLKNKNFDEAIRLTKVKSNWFQNSSFKTYGKGYFNKSSVENWKNYLNKSEKKIINILCYPEMKLLNYNSEIKTIKLYEKEIIMNKKFIVNAIGEINYKNELIRSNLLIKKKYDKNFFLNKKHFNSLINLI